MIKLSEVVAEVEKEHIKKVLKENKYNIQRTSRDLDIARNTLKERIKRYGIIHLTKLNIFYNIVYKI